MVGADLEGLVTAHDKASALVLLVAEETDITSTALLPLAALSDEAEELGTHLEELLLSLLIGDGLDLLGQLDDGLEVDILRLGDLILLAMLAVHCPWSVVLPLLDARRHWHRGAHVH